MATEIIMPKVDMVMETGTFLEWLKKEGDQVKKGEPLFVIQTDKAAIECEAPENGILAGIMAKAEDVIPVSEVIGFILAPGEKLESLPDQGRRSGKNLPDAKKPEQAGLSVIAVSDSIPASRNNKNEGLLRATPLARTIAKELGIDLGKIKGRGPYGRIYKSDVLLAAEQKQKEPRQFKIASITSLGEISISLPDASIKERIPLKGARLITAQRMTYSWQNIPHINETVSVNMEEVVRMRERVNPSVQAVTGIKVSYTAIISLAVTRTLAKHPFLNSSLNDDEIILWEDINLGLATSLEDYLIVPVVVKAQNKNLEAMVIEMDRLLTAARSRRLEPSDMMGSTFTISNLGMYGIEAFTAIINPPETAILAVGKITNTSIVIDGQTVVCPLMKMTLAADHRVVDGARAAEFLVDLKACLENPYLLM